MKSILCWNKDNTLFKSKVKMLDVKLGREKQARLTSHVSQYA